MKKYMFQVHKCEKNANRLQVIRIFNTVIHQHGNYLQAGGLN